MGEEKSTEWKRRAVATCDVELTENSAPALRLGYVAVSSKLEAPRYLMGAGYQDQRRVWLGVVADALQNGLPIPESDFLEVVAMLKKVADGEPPAKVFGLSNARGRKKEIGRLNCTVLLISHTPCERFAATGALQKTSCDGPCQAKAHGRDRPRDVPLHRSESRAG